jgi:MraZ protein
LPFTGTFRHTIDTKGRLIVPSRLRDQLEKDQVVLTVWPDGCISMWSGQGWETLQSKLLAQRQSSPRARAAVRQIASMAHTDQVDRQGRITVPQNLREHAGITRDVVVTGALDHGEIWSPEKWDGVQASDADRGGLDVSFEHLDL